MNTDKNELKNLLHLRIFVNTKKKQGNETEVLIMSKTKAPPVNSGKNQELEFKKATFEAWTRLLYKEGLIDMQHMNRMLTKIARLSA